MPKTFGYDSDGRALLERRKLDVLYKKADERAFYIALARTLYGSLAQEVTTTNPPLLPLPEDVKDLLAQRLASSPRFRKTLRDCHVPESSYNKAMGAFAGMIIQNEWDEIVR